MVALADLHHLLRPALLSINLQMHFMMQCSEHRKGAPVGLFSFLLGLSSALIYGHEITEHDRRRQQCLHNNRERLMLSSSTIVKLAQPFNAWAGERQQKQ